jgi:hypothetical protein
VAGEQGQNVLIAMLQTATSSAGISSGGTDVAGNGNCRDRMLRSAGRDITNRSLKSQCFCGGHSPGIYSESQLPEANNADLGVFHS